MNPHVIAVSYGDMTPFEALADAMARMSRNPSRPASVYYARRAIEAVARDILAVTARERYIATAPSPTRAAARIWRTMLETAEYEARQPENFGRLFYRGTRHIARPHTA